MVNYLYRYTKLIDSFLKRRYTRPINHCSQLTITELSDHGFRSKSKWFLLGSWGDGARISPRVQFIFLYTYIYSYELYVRTSKLKIKYISRIIILSLNNRLSFNLYAGNFVKASLLDYDTHHFYLSTLTLRYWASTLVSQIAQHLCL